MDHQPPAEAQMPLDHRPDGRKSWHKPEVTLLPVEQTLTGGNTGNDGAGPTTS